MPAASTTTTDPLTSHADEDLPAAVDVVVVGMGPVGTLAALLLVRAGHRVLVLERKEAAYPLPRAVAHDAEVARILASAGLPPESMPDAVEPYDDMYVWVNGQDETLHLVDWRGVDASGLHNTYFYHQPSVESHLVAALKAHPLATVRRGVVATVTGQDADGVDVSVVPATPAAPAGPESGPAPAPQTVRASWVLGADGAASGTRAALDIEWEDRGYFFDWLVVDVVPGPGLQVTHLAKQVCDPARPTTVVPAGPGRRRWEFMRLPGESAADLVRPERIWQLLAPFGVHPEVARVERGVVYTFNSAWASTWRRGRVLLLGDAAHQMPPFAGQGLAAGLRDCLNLAWKLDLVHRGLAEESLLDTYTSERSPHVSDMIEFSMSLGRIICITDPGEAAQRDAAMRAALASGAAPEPPPTPRLGPGLHTGTAGGYLSQLGRITTPGRTRPARYDDVFGPGALILADAALARALVPGQVAALAERGITVTTFDPTLSGHEGAFTDVDGTYAAWFAALGARAVLVRPDFSVFGVASTGEEVVALVVDLLWGLSPSQRSASGADPRVAWLDVDGLSADQVRQAALGVLSASESRP